MNRTTYKNTFELQEISLVNFLAALGYDPVYNKDGICAFYSPKYKRVGRARLSVLKAIRMHNEEAEEQFAMLKVTPYQEFQEYIKKDYNIDQLNMIFAGTVKIFERVKLTYSRKRGLELQSDNVKFMTKRDEAHYKEFLKD